MFSETGIGDVQTHPSWENLATAQGFQLRAMRGHLEGRQLSSSTFTPQQKRSLISARLSIKHLARPRCRNVVPEGTKAPLTTFRHLGGVREPRAVH